MWPPLTCMPARGVAVREFPLRAGPRHSRITCCTWTVGPRGVVEAKPEGHTLTGVETQSGKYGAGLPDNLPCYIRPLPFLYESTGVETRFTNRLDPQPRSRNVYSPSIRRRRWQSGWERPLPSWDTGQRQAADTQASYTAPYSLRRKLTEMPPAGRFRPLVRCRQRPSGTWSSRWPRPARVPWCRWLPAAARRSWPATRSTASSSTPEREASAVPGGPQQPGAPDAAASSRASPCPGDGRKFTELYNVQLLQSNSIDPGEQGLHLHHPAGLFHAQGRGTGPGAGGGIRLRRGVGPAIAADGGVQPELPHRGVRLHHHRRVPPLHLRPVAAGAGVLRRLPHRPDRHALQADHSGFFHQNLVMEYNHQQAVADGVNVPYNVYRIETKITEEGSTIESGMTT